MMSPLSCWWSARRVDRYLDRDPAAPLGPDEVDRLERHLAVCARCAASLADRRALRGALHRSGERHRPHAESVRRLEAAAARLRGEERP